MIESMSPNEKASPLNLQMYVHFGFALLCLPLYLFAPTVMGLILGPYLMFLILRPQSCYLPALFVHTFYGSQQRYLMATACLIYALLNMKEVAQKRVLWLFLLALIPLPFFSWYTVGRYQLFGGGIGAGGTFEGLIYYLGIFSFFWGVIAFQKIQKKELDLLIWLSMFFAIAYFRMQRNTDIIDDSEEGVAFTRYMFFALPLCVALHVRHWITRCFNFRFILLTGIIIIIFLGLIGATGRALTFTLLGVSLLAAGIIIFRKLNLRFMLFCMTSIVAFGITWGSVIWMMHNFYDYAKQTGNERYEDMKINDISSFLTKLQRKAFDDRTILWCATWESIIRRPGIFLPPLVRGGGIVYNEKTGQDVEIQLQAHNLFLELVANYAWFAGSLLYFVFVVMMLKCGKFLRIAPVESEYYSWAAVAFATGVVGGFSGQYPLTPQLSFVLLSVAGFSYRQYWNQIYGTKEIPRGILYE